jgi:plastocyanin
MNEELDNGRRLSPLLATALSIGLCAFLILALGGCGSSNDSTSNGSASSGGSSGAASSGKIDISNFEFVPKSVTVKTGTPVTWTNKDSSAHTATATGPGAGFDTGTLQQGDSKTLTVAPGTYHYICDIHPFMKATLLVK